MKMSMLVIWVVTQCTLVGNTSTLKKYAVCSSALLMCVLRLFTRCGGRSHLRVRRTAEVKMVASHPERMQGPRADSSSYSSGHAVSGTTELWASSALCFILVLLAV